MKYERFKAIQELNWPISRQYGAKDGRFFVHVWESWKGECQSIKGIYGED